MKLFRAFLFGAVASLGWFSLAHAAEMKCSPMRIVVGVPAGGAADGAARLSAERLELALGFPVIVENRPGASGNVATIAVIGSPPDGCTLFFQSTSMATFPTSFSNLQFNPFTDLVPVGFGGETPTVVVAAPSLNVNNLKELVALSKERGDGLTFSTAGYGFLQHLAIEEFKERTGAKFLHVPYRGGAPAIPDLMTGRVNFGSFAAGSILPFVRDGKLKAIGVIQEKRSTLLPETQTISEQGFAPMNASVRFVLFAPAKTPKDVVAIIDKELQKIAKDEAIKQRFFAISIETPVITAGESNAIMQETARVWGPVIKRLNVKMD
jgi:tripartite-type tricarboxylate transporter receptor subunit TctC